MNGISDTHYQNVWIITHTLSECTENHTHAIRLYGISHTRYQNVWNITHTPSDGALSPRCTEATQRGRGYSFPAPLEVWYFRRADRKQEAAGSVER